MSKRIKGGLSPAGFNLQQAQEQARIMAQLEASKPQPMVPLKTFQEFSVTMEQRLMLARINQDVLVQFFIDNGVFTREAWTEHCARKQKELEVLIDAKRKEAVLEGASSATGVKSVEFSETSVDSKVVLTDIN